MTLALARPYAAPGVIALRRGALVIACAVAAAATFMAGDPAPRLAADPDLARLLRGMAALKALIALAAAGLVWWRLARPVAPAPAAMAIAAVATLFAGAAAIFQLSFILPVAVAFHAALAALGVLALRDR